MRFEKIHYLVEGECEEHFIRENNRLPDPYLKIGKVEVFNFLTQRISMRKIMTIGRNSLLVIVFDTDIDCDLTIIEGNVAMLKKYKVDFVFVLEDKNFEDEILNSTDIKQLRDLFHSKYNSDFKKDFIKAKNVFDVLRRHHFDIGKFWCYKNPNVHFKNYVSQGEFIKKT